MTAVPTSRRPTLAHVRRAIRGASDKLTGKDLDRVSKAVFELYRQWPVEQQTPTRRLGEYDPRDERAWRDPAVSDKRW